MKLEVVPNLLVSSKRGENYYENSVTKVFNYTQVGRYNYKRDKSL